MPDIIDANGLQVKTAAEITADLQNGFRGIYGSDINVDSNSPDGQIIGIFTQMAVDIREIAMRVNAGFDPDQAQGVILDQRLAINNIDRIGGTFTVQPIDLVINATTTLQGLDANADSVNGTGYTIQDDSGNQYILFDTETFTAGTYSRNFRAKTIGAVSVPVNTITNPVTIVLAVTSVNNSSAPLSIGINQETDPNARVRRQQSVANASNGYSNGLLGLVLALSGVTDAVLNQNVTDTTDGNGIPGHCIWLVVEGGANSDIGNLIYGKISDGCNMKGSVSVNITSVNRTLFTAKFDRPTPENLYVRFNIQTTTAGFSFDQAGIKAYIVANKSYKIGAFAETSSLTTLAVAAIADQGGGGVPTEMQISVDGTTWVDFLETATLDKQWTIDVSRITITVLT